MTLYPLLFSHCTLLTEKISTATQCTEECGSNASCECKACGLVLCDGCFDKIHSISVSFKKHVKSPLGSSAQEKPSQCSEHGKDLELVCTQCNDKLICLLCLTHGSHKSHNTLLIKDHIGNAKKSLSIHLSELNQRLSIIEKARDAVQSSIEEILQVLLLIDDSIRIPLFLTPKTKTVNNRKGTTD